MIKKHKLENNSRGAAAILVTMLILTLMLTISLVVAGLMVQELRISRDMAGSFKAYEMAVAGMERGNWEVKQQDCDAINVNFSENLTTGESYQAVWKPSGRLESMGNFKDLERNLAGNLEVPLAYVAHNKLDIYNVCDPTSPVTVATNFNGGGSIQEMSDLAVRNSFVYGVETMGGANSFEVINVANASAPKLVGSTENVTLGTGVKLKGDYAYATVSGNANIDMVVIKVNDPTAPLRVGQLDLSSVNPSFNFLPKAIDLSGNYAFIAGSSGGVQYLIKVDISNPISPVYDSELILASGTAEDVFIDDNWAYVANGLGFLKIDINSMTLANTYVDATGGVFNIFIKDGYAYITTDNNIAVAELKIVNTTSMLVSGSLNLHPAFFTALSDGFTDIYVYGDYVYLTVDGLVADRLHIIDVSNFGNLNVAASANVSSPQAVVVVK